MRIGHPIGPKIPIRAAVPAAPSIPDRCQIFIPQSTPKPCALSRDNFERDSDGGWRNHPSNFFGPADHPKIDRQASLVSCGGKRRDWLKKANVTPMRMEFAVATLPRKFSTYFLDVHAKLPPCAKNFRIYYLFLVQLSDRCLNSEECPRPILSRNLQPFYLSSSLLFREKSPRPGIGESSVRSIPIFLAS